MTKPVLIVEDERDIRETLAEILKLEGFAVQTACHGLDALEKLRHGGAHPGLILLDLMMPVMDGRRFLELLSAEPAELTRIPVVVFSAAANVKPIDYPIAGYLSKPAGLDDILHWAKQTCATS